MVLSATIFFCLLVALLLWVIIGGKGHWLLKALLIVPTIWFSVAVGNSLPTMLGWPTSDELPEKYELIGAKIEHPNLKTGRPGRILLWVQDMEPSEDKYRWSLYKPDINDSRLHVIPYSKKMHKRVEGAIKLLRQGKRVMGENRKGKGGAGKGTRKGKQGKGGKLGGGDEGDDSVGPKFYVMPPVQLPQKRG